MASAPRLPCGPLGLNWTGSTGPDDVVLEVFIDFCCPFSKRIFDRLVGEVIPHYAKAERPVRVVFQFVPQPWHPQSAMVHEAAIAAMSVGSHAAGKSMAAAIFANQEDFFDVSTYDKSRADIMARLTELAVESGVERSDFSNAIKLDLAGGAKNSGTATTRVLKFYVKYHRLLSIHVTPTIRVNGLVCDSSSSWTLEQWMAFLDPLLSFDGRL
mmetsp:Transcript_58/g.162  ORF Transcript_58/g.162 Transcript_58/m.162 type:complete len:213 (+) Transcript_58:191-829(+)|eukprot:CAMPEP_0119123396 /NCGR_PEP_ID=MMETSP1310-20130426/3352_1 /TAXON_ID=464262 /ORGANISM="Genus nov. species nov., Strain RCC2339" /LENGTH=212 /DNA_ID=CAMNT_0007113195 /DNA_START=189 /DNA_END=827 /DNA_ORIENTATION=-